MLSRDSPLSESYLEAAKKELHENPKHQAAHLVSLKRALHFLPHIKCPNDDRIYLAFLRHAKFNHPLAEKRFDNFVTLRTSPEHPQHDWFNRPEFIGEVTREYLKAGVHLPLGFVDDGKFVFVVRLGSWRFDLAPFTEYIKLAVMQIDRLMEDPRIQIKGVVLLFDMSGISAKDLISLNPRKNVKHLMQYFQEGCVLRMKHMIYYNEPPVMDAVIKLMMQWINPKLKKRILRVKSDLRKAWTQIPGLKSILPQEYGGDGDSLANTIDRCARELVEYFQEPLLWDAMKVDESKRPPSAKNRITKYNDADQLYTGTQGTYISFSDDT